jgi:hypothetical protein
VEFVAVNAIKLYKSEGYTDMPLTASSITRSHFNAVAEIIHDAQPIEGSTSPQAVERENTLLHIAGRLATLYEKANHSFLRNNFLIACGPGPRRGGNASKTVTAAVKIRGQLRKEPT